MPKRPKNATVGSCPKRACPTRDLPPAFIAFMIALAALALPNVLVAAPPCPIVYAFKEKIMFQDGKAGPPLQLGQGRQPTLSPSSKHVVWVENGQDPKKAQLILYNMESQSTSTLAKPGGYINTPRISPDGKRVLYVRSTDTNIRELWLVSPGSQPARLAQAGGPAGDDFFEPMWTPDGTRICYQDMHNVYWMSAEGKIAAKTPLAAMGDGRAQMFSSSDRFALRPGADGVMVFSMAVPGSKLFQKKVPDVSSALFLYDTASRKTTRITQENMTAFSPSWSPNGQEIIFYGYVDTLAASSYPFRVYSLHPGGTPVEICPGQDPMTSFAP